MLGLVRDRFLIHRYMLHFRVFVSVNISLSFVSCNIEVKYGTQGRDDHQRRPWQHDWSSLPFTKQYLAKKAMEKRERERERERERNQCTDTVDGGIQEPVGKKICTSEIEIAPISPLCPVVFVCSDLHQIASSAGIKRKILCPRKWLKMYRDIPSWYCTRNERCSRCRRFTRWRRCCQRSSGRWWKTSGCQCQP